MQETGTDTYIIRSGLLPLQVRIGHVGDIVCHCFFTIVDKRSGVRRHIGTKLVVADFLVTHHTYRGTQLDEVNILAQMQPAFTVNVPRQTQ